MLAIAAKAVAKYHGNAAAQEVGALKFKNEASLASSTTPGHLDLPGVVQLARSSEAKILTKADAVNQYGDSPLPGEQSESGPE